jgi:tetratricopeptide (TPR) repeat protein
MKKHFFTFLFFNCLLFMTPSFGQTPKLDSLLHLLKTVKEDTSKVNIFNNLFLEYEYTDVEKANEYLSKALKIGEGCHYMKGVADTHANEGFLAQDQGSYDAALESYLSSLKLRQELSDKKGIADCYNYIGSVYYSQGSYVEALNNYFTSLKIKKMLNDKKGEANLYNNIGLVYDAEGNYPEELKNHLAALKIREALDDKMGIASSYNNMGALYDAQGNYTEALKNYNASLKIKNVIGDKSGIASTYINIGIINREQSDFSSALKNDLSSLKIYEELGDQSNIASAYNNIGNVYYYLSGNESNAAFAQKDLDKALINYTSCLKINETTGAQAGITYSYGNIGNVLMKQRKYQEAKEYILKANELSKKIGYKEYLRDSYSALSQLDSSQGNFKGAYGNHKLFILYRDSLNNEETQKKTIQSQMTYDFEKKEAVATAEHKKELENQQILANEKSRKQNLVLGLVSCFLVFVLFFAGFIFRSLSTTRKQKNIIEQQKNIVETQKLEVEHQKLLVEEHQKEIIDSIMYARRIQRALLPTEMYIEKNLKRLMKK